MLYIVISLFGFISSFWMAVDAKERPRLQAWLTLLAILNGCFVLDNLFHLVAKNA